MKYYELYISNYWANDPEMTLTPITVEKETPNQITIIGAKSYRRRLNKSELMQVVESSYSKYIFFAEGQEKEAISKITEAMDREINHLDKKLKALKYLKSEVTKLGKEKHN